MLSWIAACAYLATAAACLAAARIAPRTDRGSSRSPGWFAIAILFLCLAAIRASGADVTGGTAIRALLVEDGDYDLRQKFQAPIAAALIVLGFIIAVAAIRHRKSLRARFGRALSRALAASAGMIGLVALRAVSFHPTDAVLYAGPVHPNWVIDAGLTIAVAVCAVSEITSRRRRSPG